MRILDVDNGYSPTGGGIRTYHDRKLAFFASRAEHDYALVIPGARDEVESHGPRAHLIRLRGVPVGAGYRAMLSPRALARAIEGFRPELVEVGSPYLLPHLLRPALARVGAASVGFFHTDYPELFARQPLAYVGARLAARAERLAERHVGFQYRGFTAALGASEHSLARLRAGGVTAHVSHTARRRSRALPPRPPRRIAPRAARCAARRDARALPRAARPREGPAPRARRVSRAP